MKLNKSAYNLIYKMRKKEANINTRKRVLFYNYNDTEALKSKQYQRLFNEFGFVGQSEIC
jgi:hypothetical protein